MLAMHLSSSLQVIKAAFYFRLIMASLFRCLVHFLCCGIVLVNGQCTVWTYTGSESDEDLRESLEEHGIQLRSLGEQLFSTFENLEMNVKRTIVRALEENDENLRASLQNLSSSFVNGLQKLERHAQNKKDIYFNTSIKSEKIDERIQDNECLKVEEKRQFLTGLILNWSSQVEKIEESIEAVNETLERKLEGPNQRLISLYQSLSARLDNIGEKYDVIETVISKKEEEHEKKLELMDQNLSSKFKSTNESILRVLENAENIQQMCKELFSVLQAMNESTARSSSYQESKLQIVYDRNLRILDEKLSSTFGNFEVSNNRSIVRGLEERVENLRAALHNLSSTFENSDKKLIQELDRHAQKMKDIYHNTSIKSEKIDERIQDNECLNVEEKKQFLMGLILNWSSQVEKIEESIEAVNETLERKLEEPNQRLVSSYQNLSARLDNIDAKFDTMQTVISKKGEEHEKKLEIMDQNLSSKFKSTNESLLRVLENDENIQQVYERLSSRLQAMNESMVRSSRDNELKLQAIHENFSATIGKFYEKLTDVLDLANQSIQNAKPKGHSEKFLEISDCSTIRDKGNTTSGVYRVFVDHQQRRRYANAFCDMTTTNGGWTVFQRRRDGSENFYRGWDDYANGFGNSSGEFWIGNEFLHILTSEKRYKLRIDLEDFAGNKKFAEYSTFNISSSTNKYSLTVGNYSGNAGDSLSYHSGHKFSTKDQDNDVYKTNCSNTERGAWWYGNCHQSNLNGIYYRGGNYMSPFRPSNGDGIVWKDWLEYSYSLKKTEMKIAPY